MLHVRQLAPTSLASNPKVGYESNHGKASLVDWTEALRVEKSKLSGNWQTIAVIIKPWQNGTVLLTKPLSK